MGTSMISSYIINTYNAGTHAAPAPAAAAVARAPVPPPPMPMIGPDPSTWGAIIAKDEAAQRDAPPQPPLSDAYQQGGGKKRKGRAAATPDGVLAERMRSASKRTGSKRGAKNNDSGRVMMCMSVRVCACMLLVMSEPMQFMGFYMRE